MATDPLSGRPAQKEQRATPLARAIAATTPLIPGVALLLLFLAMLSSMPRPLQGLLAAGFVAALAAQPSLRQRTAAFVAHVSPHTLALCAVAVLALGLRVWGYGWGLPYFEHADEWAVADKALEMARSGNFNPQRFIYPNLYIYLQLGVVILHFFWGVSAGIYQTLADIDPVRYYAWARLLTAVLGTGAVLATYAAARLLYGRQVALLAAGLLAVLPSHVADSHYVTVDTPSSFFTMLAFVGIAGLAVRPPYARSQRLALVLLCGFAVGLAMGTKYNVALLLLPLLLASVWAELDRRDSEATPVATLLASGASLLYGLAGIALGFTLSTPYWLAELPRMLNEVASIVVHYKFKGHPGHESDAPGLTYAQLVFSDAPLPALAAALGLGLAFVRLRRADLLLLAFFVPSLLQLAGLKVVFGRNLMPLLPFVCIFAALAAVTLVRWSLGAMPQAHYRWAPRVLALTGVLLIVGPLVTSVSDTIVLARPTTRILATAWVQEHAPAGSRIWLEDQTLILPSDRYRVSGGRPVVEHALSWYREQGFRYLVASVSGYNREGRSKLEELAAGAEVTRFDGEGRRRGPYLLIIATGLPDPATEPRIRLDAPLAGGALVLEGYRHPGTVAAGAILPLALFWRTEQPLGRDYTVFVHLLDAQGNRVAQRDVAPLEGSFPTSQWQAGELLRDDQDLAVPVEVPPGIYQLSVGMYHPDTMEQLNAAPILLAPVEVTR